MSVLNGRKNTSMKKQSSSLPCAAILPTNDIRDVFKRVEKRKEEKLQDQVNDNLTEDNSNINLTD